MRLASSLLTGVALISDHQLSDDVPSGNVHWKCKEEIRP
jgi:hypothetical protein